MRAIVCMWVNSLSVIVIFIIVSKVWRVIGNYYYLWKIIVVLSFVILGILFVKDNAILNN